MLALYTAIPQDWKRYFDRYQDAVKLRTEAEKKASDEQIKIARELIAKEGAYNRACFEAICGNSDEALAVLKMALERGEESLEWVEHDPDFDLLRGDPRFAALIEEMKARFAAG